MPIYYYEDGTFEDVHESRVQDFTNAFPNATLEPPTETEEEVEKTNDVADQDAPVTSETT